MNNGEAIAIRPPQVSSREAAALILTGAIQATPMQASAFELYEMGFSIGPAKPASKLPYLYKRLTYSRIDPRFIFQLFDARENLLVICGAISGNLTILDCENLAETKRHEHEFNSRGLKPWQVSTARGGHFWWLGDVETANAPKQKTDGDYEIRGRLRYCMAPPSVHPSGMIYDWVFREGERPPLIPITALNWLPIHPAVEERRKWESTEAGPLACLFRNTREFIERGTHPGERNNRLFAAACDLQANGFTYSDARDLLSPAVQRCGLPQGEFSNTLKSAYSKARSTVKDSKVRIAPKWERARQWAEAHTWEPLTAVIEKRNLEPRIRATLSRASGSIAVSYNVEAAPVSETELLKVSARTARSVFIALCERARREHPADVFRASLRETAEIARMKPLTVGRAIKCLEASGFIKSCGHNEQFTGLYALGDKTLHKGHSKTLWSLSTVSPTQQSKDLFSRDGLGEYSGEIWRLILTEPCKAAEIARRVKVHPSTAGRALRGLEAYRLAQKEPGGIWAGIAAGKDRMGEIALQNGTTARVERRKERHKQERSHDVTMAIKRRQGKATPARISLGAKCF